MHHIQIACTAAAEEPKWRTSVPENFEGRAVFAFLFVLLFAFVSVSVFAFALSAGVPGDSQDPGPSGEAARQRADGP